MKVASFVFLSCYLTIALTIPTSTDLTTEATQTSHYDATVPQYLLPGYYYPTFPDHFYHLPTTQDAISSTESRALETTIDSDESRTISFLLNFIVLPKLILKFVTALAFGVSAALKIGAFVFLLSATLCTFTPFCVLGLAIPGLRNAERSGRNIVQQMYEHVPGEKIEAGKGFKTELDLT